MANPSPFIELINNVFSADYEWIGDCIVKVRLTRRSETVSDQELSYGTDNRLGKPAAIDQD
jgi:hypothetical protein